jgi:hypothetical protein
MRFKVWLFLYRITYWLLVKTTPPAREYEFVVGGTRYIGCELNWSFENGKIVGRLNYKPEAL